MDLFAPFRAFSRRHGFFGALSKPQPSALAGGSLLCCLAVLAGGGEPEDWSLKHGVIWYASARDDGVLEVAARRYRVGITGKGDRDDADRVAIKTRNPAFRWFVYNSATDNYVTSPQGTPEHDLLAELATRRGWDLEEVYLHYWDDTRLVLEGDTILVRGWGGGSARSPAEARVPVYYRNLSRRLVHFATPRAAQLHREAMVQLAFAEPFAASTVYPDGIFLDNATAQLFNFGNILSGGRVREAPAHAPLGSREYLRWHWHDNFGPFLTALKDTLEAAASWAPDRQRKFLMINVANIWDDGYVSRDVADILFQEFLYNPVRSFGRGMVEEAYRRNALAEAAGIATFYSASTARSVQGRTGEFSYAQVLLGNLVYYLVSRTQSTLFYEMGTNMPSVAGWDTLTWRGCIDAAAKQLGAPAGGPYTLAQGKDPLGNPYEVKARRYERGLVVLRNRGDWNQGIETESAVTVDLPAPLAPVDPAGRVGVAVTSLRLRNGAGAMLLGSVPGP